ncbi:cereblon family protein [Aestuariirhabdus sp. LZHN29]|uniref:cereblon family protein n=1 Tax=Aestuariirhabdus sp. LZHN29 TaxID=3417462 RepID=UPI003CF482AF
MLATAYLFQEEGEQQLLGKLLPKTHRLLQPEPQRLYLCIHCRQVLSDQQQLLAVKGAHEHYRINPAGVEFRFICLRQAEGCRIEGAPTREASWFSSHLWQCAHCTGCHTQLGWYFSGCEPAFFGLIKNKLLVELAG